MNFYVMPTFGASVRFCPQPVRPFFFPQSPWDLLDGRIYHLPSCASFIFHVTCMLMHPYEVPYAQTRGRPCLTDIVFDTVNRMACLPEMTFIVIKNWEMVSASLISDSQSWIDGMYRERRC